MGHAFEVDECRAGRLAFEWDLYRADGPARYLVKSTSSTTIGDVPYFGAPLNYDPRQVNGPAFDVSAFTPPTCRASTGSALATSCITANQFAYHVRTFSTTLSSVRGDITNQANASLLKRFDIREKMYLQLRFEVFNLLNHPSFSFPNVATNKLGIRTDYCAVQSAEKRAGRRPIRVLGQSSVVSYQFVTPLTSNLPLYAESKAMIDSREYWRGSMPGPYTVSLIRCWTLLVIFATLPIHAQVDTGSISGVVNRCERRSCAGRRDQP